jgi:hypothetical protein
MCRVSTRRLSIHNFVWGLLKVTKKVYLIPQKWKKTKIHIGSIQQSLPVQPKNIKNYQKNLKFSQNMYVYFLKSEKEPKIRMGATRRNSPREPEKQ